MHWTYFVSLSVVYHRNFKRSSFFSENLKNSIYAIIVCRKQNQRKRGELYENLRSPRFVSIWFCQHFLYPASGSLCSKQRLAIIHRKQGGQCHGNFSAAAAVSWQHLAVCSAAHWCRDAGHGAHAVNPCAWRAWNPTIFCRKALACTRDNKTNTASSDKTTKGTIGDNGSFCLVKNS